MSAERRTAERIGSVAAAALLLAGMGSMASMASAGPLAREDGAAGSARQEAEESGDAQDPQDAQAAPPAERATANERRAAALAELATLLELGLVGDALAFGLPLVAGAQDAGDAGDDGDGDGDGERTHSAHGLADGALAGDGHAVALVARALFAAGREDESTALLRDAAVDPATGGWIQLEWARIAIARDELDQALSYLVSKQGELLLPRYDQSFMLTGRTLFRRGNLAAAARFLTDFVERAPFHPDTVSAYHMLALEAVQRRDAETAATMRAEAQRRRRAFELVRARSLQVRANPKDALPRYGLGLAFLELGDAEMAAQTLHDLLLMHPDFQRAYFQYGEALRATGRRDLALEAFGEGLVRSADDHKCRLNRGLVLVELGRYGEALTDFEELLVSEVADDPQYAGLYLGLTRVYAARGDTAAADQAYARYRELGGEEPR